jgi:hypothetical protein
VTCGFVDDAADCFGEEHGFALRLDVALLNP